MEFSFSISDERRLLLHITTCCVMFARYEVWFLLCSEDFCIFMAFELSFELISEMFSLRSKITV